MARPLALALAAAALLASHASASTRIAGGSPIGIQQAPWAVLVQNQAASGRYICSGSIIDPTHVVSAAHCIFDPDGAQSPPAALTVRAGVSNFVLPLPSETPQDRHVVAYRIHPGYRWTSSGAPDDLVVLTLDTPLDLSGPTAQAATLPTAATPYPAKALVGLAGFGRVNPDTPASGALVGLTQTVESQGVCGEPLSIGALSEDAILLCASTPAGAACQGDSGAGLVTPDTHVLLGVVSGGAKSCGAGSDTLYAWLGASEILSFIQGNDQPPTAPRETAITTIRLHWDPPLVVGTTLTCSSTRWNGAPTFAFAFVDGKTNVVLQQGDSPTYLLTAADQGRRVRCRVYATNPGGTAVDWTDPTPPVGALPRVVIERLDPLEATPGSHLTVKVTIRTPAGLRGKFGVCVTLATGVGGRACTSSDDESGTAGAYEFSVHFRIAATAPLGPSYATISAVAGLSSAQGRALLRISPLLSKT